MLKQEIGTGILAIRRFLDIGCGTGIPISILFNQNKNAMYGLDHAPKMIQTFQRNPPHATS